MIFYLFQAVRSIPFQRKISLTRFFIIFKAEPIYSGGGIYRGRYDTEMFNSLIKSTVQIKNSENPKLHEELKSSIESLIEIMVEQPDGFRYLGISKIY